jgi:hypothetical protein
LEGKIFKLPLDKEDKFKEGSWRLTKGRGEYLVFGKEKEENECVRKRLIIMCGKMCANKSMERNCV